MSDQDKENQTQEGNEPETMEELEAQIAAEEAAQESETQEQEEELAESSEDDAVETEESSESTIEPDAAADEEEAEEEEGASEEEADEEAEPVDDRDPVEIGFDFYLNGMRPGLPITIDTGLVLQQKLYRHVLHLLTSGDVRYNIERMVAMVTKYRGEHFHETKLFRCLDHKRVDSGWRTRFENLMTLLLTMADVPNRSEVARHVDVEVVVNSVNSKEAADNLMSYINS